MDLKPREVRDSKTRQSLLNTIKILLTNQDFDTITVKQICKQALVSKSTFYQYFWDKYDLVIALILSEIKPPSEMFTNQNMTQYFIDLFNTMDKHKKLIDHIIRQPGGNAELQGRVMELWLEGFRYYYTGGQPNTGQESIPQEMAIIYNCYGAISLIWWF